MKKFSVSLAWFLLLILCTVFSVSAAEDVVYVDGTGATEGAYTTLVAAINAVSDGGTVILTGATATPTSAPTTLPAKCVTITSQNDAALTIGRALKLGADTKFEKIKIINGAASGIDLVYGMGHNLTVGEGVVTEANASTKRYLGLYVGNSGNETATIESGSVLLCSGTWRTVFVGSYNKPVNGTVSVGIDGAEVTTLTVGNGSSGTNTATALLAVKSGSVGTLNANATFTGTAEITLTGGEIGTLKLDATVDLTDGGSVSITTENATVTTKALAGYTVVHEGTTYYAPYVYLDGTGATAGAYTALLDAANALPASGGTIFVCGNTSTPTTAAVQLPAKKLTVTSQNGATLTFRRALLLSEDLVFENISIKNGAAATVDFLYAMGHKLTIGEGVVTEVNASTNRYMTVLVGNNKGDLDHGEVLIQSGTWRRVFVGNYQATVTGTMTVTVEGGTIVDAICVGNSNSGTNSTEATVHVRGGYVASVEKTESFTGTAEITLTGGEIGTLKLDATVDLTDGGSVSITTENATVTTKAAEGYRVAHSGSVYTVVQENDVTLTFVSASAAIYANGKSTLRYITKITGADTDKIEYFGTILVPISYFGVDTSFDGVEDRADVAKILYTGAVESETSYSADLAGIPASERNTRILAWSFVKLVDEENLRWLLLPITSVEESIGGQS